MLDAKLLFLLLVVLGLMQGLCWLLARGLGCRLQRRVMALGLLLPVLFLSPWLRPSRLLAPSDILRDFVPGAPIASRSVRHDLLNDAVFQFLPWELDVRQALSGLRLPLWSDVLDGGSSPWVNPQAGALSPIAMPARAFPIEHHLLAMLALKMLVAFDGTWLLCRAVGAGRRSSLLAAAGFTLGGGMMSWALFPQTAVVAWVPWLALGTVRLFRGGGSRALATTGLLFAALLLSGHPETAAAGGLLAALCGPALRSRRRSFLRGFASATLAAVLGLAIAAPQWLPFLLYLPESQRAQETLGREMPPHFFDRSNVLTWFLPGYAQFMQAPLSPRVFGRPFQDEFHGPFNWVDANAGYAGLLALAGSWVALLAARKRRAWPFLAFALASLLLAAQALPLAHLIFAVPPLRAVAWGRFLLPGCLALCVAGALGLDHLLHARRRRLAAWIALGIAAALSLSAYADPWTVLLWLLLGAGALAAWKSPPWGKRSGTTLFALVLLLDLIPWSQALLPYGDPFWFYPQTGLVDLLKRETSGAGGPWRVAGEGRAVFPAALSVYGLEDARTHNPLAPMSYLRTLEAAFGFAPTRENYYPALGNLDHPLLDFLGVRAVVHGPGSTGPIPPAMPRIDDGRDGRFRLHRNPEALPRWFFPTKVDTIGKRSLRAWLARLDDPRRIALWTGQAGNLAGAMPPRGAVRAVAQSPGHIVLKVTAPAETLLATSVLLLDGWRVSVNERQAAPLVVNGAFLGFRVPAGESRIELRYIPPGLLPGFLLGGAGLIAVAWLLRRKRLPPLPMGEEVRG